MPQPHEPNLVATTTDQNYLLFLDCLSTHLHHYLSQPLTSDPTRAPRKHKTKPARRTTIKPVTPPAPTDADAQRDAEDLAEFAEYLAFDIFAAFQEDLRTLCYADVRNDAGLAERYSLPLSAATVDDIAGRLSPSTIDSLTAYNLLPPSSSTTAFLTPLLANYIGPLTTPPASLPAPGAPRATACELCARDWIPLTYHHLIPRSVHAKVLKRGWHEEWALNSVAWLCRACHSFVHGCAGNEELAREWYSVELLLGREDVGRWIKWVGRVRWKSR